MIKKLSHSLYLIACLALSPSYAWQEKPILLKLQSPVFEIPHFSGFYSQREVSVSPEEYEIAEKFRLLLAEDKKQEVIAELNKFYDLELSPAMLTLKAQIYFSIEEYKNAEKYYLNVLKRMPQLVRVHRDLGQLYLVTEKYTEAREHFAKAISFGAMDATIYGQLGYLNLNLHGPLSAVAAYQQALSLEPNEEQWQQGLFLALTQAKMFPAAQALLSELVAKHPNDKNLWLNQAILALDSGNDTLALASLEMAILLGETDANNLKTAAQLHLQQQSYDRAIELIEQDLTYNQLNIDTVNEYLIWLDQLQMWQQASTLLDNLSAQIDSLAQHDQSVLYSHRARISAKREQYQAAERYFKLALTTNPNNGHALINYAKLASEQKNNIVAELMYIRAQALPAFEKEALLGQAQLYINMQDYVSAIEQLQKASLKYPELHQLTEQIEIIKNIIRLENSSTI